MTHHGTVDRFDSTTHDTHSKLAHTGDTGFGDTGDRDTGGGDTSGGDTCKGLAEKRDKGVAHTCDRGDVPTVQQSQMDESISITHTSTPHDTSHTSQTHPKTQPYFSHSYPVESKHISPAKSGSPKKHFVFPTPKTGKRLKKTQLSRKTKRAQVMTRVRVEESPEKTAARQSFDRARRSQRRKQESPDETAARQSVERVRVSQRRGKETPDETAARQSYDRDHKSQRRKHESPDETAARQSVEKSTA